MNRMRRSSNEYDPRIKPHSKQCSGAGTRSSFTSRCPMRDTTSRLLKILFTMFSSACGSRERDGTQRERLRLISFAQRGIDVSTLRGTLPSSRNGVAKQQNQFRMTPMRRLYRASRRRTRKSRSVSSRLRLTAESPGYHIDAGKRSSFTVTTA